MSALLKFLVFSVAITACFAVETCSYDYCTKDELKNGCVEVGDKDTDQAACLNSNKLYLSFKTGTLSFTTKHACCNWTMNDINNKYLYCVKKIRSRAGTCFEGTKSNYKYKIKTRTECTKFSCLDN